MIENVLNRKTSVLLLIVGIVIIVSSCSAEKICVGANENEQIICDRKENFNAIGRRFKSIDDEIKSGKPDYDEVARSAKYILNTGKDITSWFPQGTGPEVGFSTDAKEEIWKQPEEFYAAYKEFITESERLITSASLNDKSALEAQFNITGVTCSNCHKPFRADQQ